MKGQEESNRETEEKNKKEEKNKYPKECDFSF